MNSLFPEIEFHQEKAVKKPRLGRYENVQKQLVNAFDQYRIFVDAAPIAPLQPLNFVDLFCGAGGMTLGLSHAGFQARGSVEISSVASATHRQNFPDCQHFEGDIADYDAKKWSDLTSPEIHLVSGGPPCQGFSVAGGRDPNDPRNKLFREFVRVVNIIRPWYVVMENVPGIITMQQGAVKEAILQAFAEIGYPNMSVVILESAAYGVPQIRPRAFFIANRLGLPNPYPKPQLTTAEYLPIEKSIADLATYSPIPEINHEWTKHSKAFMQRISEVPAGGSLYKTFADAFKRQYLGTPSMTIKENHGGTHIHPFLNRVISAREMARLQSFPDNFLFTGTMKKAMWQIGNAVPPRLAECIGQALIWQINQHLTD